MRVLLFAGLAGLVLTACAGGRTGGSTATGLARPEAGATPRQKVEVDQQRAFEEGVRAITEQRAAKIEDPDALAKTWARAVKKAPDVGEAYHNLGVALERLGRLDEAEKAYRQALVKKPSLRQSAQNLAVLQEKRGRTARAAKIYQEILRVYPDDAAARVRLAEIVRARGDARRAEVLARAALERAADSAGAYVVLMKIELDRKHPDLARLLALKAQKLTPDDPEIPLGMARADLLLGREPSARRNLEKVIALDPSRLEAHLALFRLARAHQDWASVEAHLAPILKADPENAAAWVSRGVALRAQGRPDEAAEAYEKALRIAPKLPEAHLGLAILYQRVRQAPKPAIEHARKFLAVNRALNRDVPPDHPARQVIKEAEETLRIEKETARMEAEAARMEAKMMVEQKKAEEAARKKAEAAAAAKASAEGGQATEGGERSPGEGSPDPKASTEPTSGDAVGPEPKTPGSG